jgi:acetyl esterase/lipase
MAPHPSRTPDPDRATGTGTGIVIAPGGGFHFLSMDNEGAWVAQRLAERGVAGLVLHYRVMPTAVDRDAFDRQVDRAFSDPEVMSQAHATHHCTAVEDGATAVRYVRDHAAGWHLDPDRIGMLGFSAGAYVTGATVVEAPPQARPAFGGLIYPSRVEGAAVPRPTPPLFLAWASDDPLGEAIVGSALAIYDTWRTAGGSVEAHAYATGGHGFGMAPRGTGSDRWFDEFCAWLDARGY